MSSVRARVSVKESMCIIRSRACLICVREHYLFGCRQFTSESGIFPPKWVVYVTRTMPCKWCSVNRKMRYLYTLFHSDISFVFFHVYVSGMYLIYTRSASHHSQRKIDSNSNNKTFDVFDFGSMGNIVLYICATAHQPHANSLTRSRFVHSSAYSTLHCRCPRLSFIASLHKNSDLFTLIPTFDWRCLSSIL